MKGESERIFFPRLERQASYPTRPDGEFFAYAHYREHIAADCQHRCVYCDARDADVGGAEAMQLDHFRPESFDEFADLRNDPRNLHYACGRCNLLKWKHWPARGTDATHDGRDGFIDPFVEDRLGYFEIAANGEIRELLAPGRYMIRLLRLDREFLRKLRELRLLRSIWQKRVAALRVRIENGDMPKPGELAKALATVEELLAGC